MATCIHAGVRKEGGFTIFDAGLVNAAFAEDVVCGATEEIIPANQKLPWGAGPFLHCQNCIGDKCPDMEKLPSEKPF